MMQIEQPTTPVVDAISEINFEGNIVPHSWYRTIVKKTKRGTRPDVAAILILADTVYWYRAAEDRDETTNQVVGRRRKFEGDMLQRHYRELAEFFGFSKKQVTGAIDRLVKMGLVRREFRTVRTPRGKVLSNVVYLEPVPEEIKKITFRVGGRGAKRPRSNPPGQENQLFH